MNKRTKYLLVLIALLCITSLISYGYSYAKYVSNHAWNYYLGTKGFYFSSDELGINKINNVNNNWHFDSTYFTLKNSDNDYLISDYDIEYTVNCTIQNDAANYSKCVLNGTDSDTFSAIISSSRVCKNNKDDLDVSSYNKEKCESSGYEWTLQENYKELYFDIIKTSDENINYVSVLIEVTSVFPYSKKLIGEFNLSSVDILENGFKIDYKEFDNYSRVVVTNSYDEDKCVKLKWDSDKLKIDNTNDEFGVVKYDDNNNINEINFNINKNDNVSYVFYKTDFELKYNYKDFSLVESYDCR